MTAARSPIGVVLGSHMPPEKIVATARRAEELGYGELWFSEDCFFTGAFAGIAAALGATRELPMGLGIASAVTRHPALLAMECATLSRIFPGRFLPGVGLGVPFWLAQMGIRPRSPLTALRECVTGLRRLLDGETVSERGRVFAFDGVALTHRPHERLPIYMGVVGPKGLQLSGELADGTVLSVLAGSEYIRWARERIAEGQAAAGRTGEPHRVVTYVLYAVDDDPAAARAAVRDVVAFYLAAMPENAITEVLGIQAEVQEKLARGGLETLTRELPDAWIDAMAIAGTPAECAAKLQEFLAAGSDAIGLWLFPLDRGEQVLERTARDVLPRL
jgi:alkanesulfonate monooxygenase SsuD/methylene tetrahydromethanopterin reductase-like flavin-dependent oxidoreductase (luciferase family)